jgi:hypothetical protein
MGEALPLFPAEFNGSIRIEAREERLTSDAGVFALRESLERLKMWSWLDEGLRDERTPELVTHPFIELVRTSILLQAQGYRDLDDADALRMDAALRLAVSSRKGTSPLVVPERPEGKPAPKNPSVPEHLASQPTLSRLTAALATADNRQVLREGLAVLAGRRLAAEQGRLPEELTVDIDSLPIEVEGKQPEASYNGHYRATIYHPLVATVAETGDLIDVNLRRGNCHTAEGAMEFLEPLLERVETHMCHKASVRMDAGFPSEGLLAALEKRGTAYVARVRNNAVLDRMAMPLLKRPAGRRPKEPRTWCHEMSYRAESWSRERRVVLVVLEREEDLFLHHFWLITNWTAAEKDAETLLQTYRKRGAAEGYMGELMSVLAPALSSSPRPKAVYAGHAPSRLYQSVDAFAVNEVRLLLSAWAYGAMHVCRKLMAAQTNEGWSLQRLRERLLKVAARVLLHSRRVTVVIAQPAAQMWRDLWSRLDQLACPQAG